MSVRARMDPAGADEEEIVFFMSACMGVPIRVRVRERLLTISD